MDKQIRDISKKRTWKRILKRSVALLCAVVMLFTMNTLKRNADTLERIAMCGYAEHVHSASCFSGDVLVCGMEEHVHTDACYQESPASMDMDDLDIEVDEPIVDDTVEELDLSLTLDNFDLVTEDVVAEPVSNEVEEKVYSLGTGAMVSHIIGAVGLGVSLSEIIEVAAVENDEAHSGLIAVEKVDGDYRVWAKRDFAEAELALIITDDIYVVKLTDGIAQREDATPEVQPAIEDAPAVQIGADAPAELPAIEDAPTVDAHAGDDDHVEVPVIEDEAPVDGQDEDTLHVEDVSPEAEQQVGKGEQLDIEDVPGEQAVDQGDEQPAGEAGEAQGEEPAVGEAAEGLSLEEAGEEQGDEQPAGEAGEEQGEEPAVGEVAEGLSLEEADEAQGEEQPAEEADEAQVDGQPAEGSDEAQGDGQPAEGSDEAQGDEQPAEGSDEEQGEEQPAEGSDEAQGDGQPAEGSDEEQGDGQPAEGSDEEQGDGQPAEEADEAQVDGQPSEEADEEQPSEEATDEQSEDEVAEEQTTGESESPVYTATIDLAEVEAYPLSLNAMLAAAKPEAAEAEEAAVEGEGGEEAAVEEEADAEANPTPIIEYDAELLEVVEQDGDWLVTPIRGFEETRIAVDNGSRYELTLVNCVLADEAGEEQEEQLEEQPAPVYTATVDLTDATYPLSLNAMLATVTPALDGEQAAQDDEQPAEAQDDEQPAEAQSEEQPAERPTPAIEYDEALLEIAESDGDHLITPIQSFENTRIIVDNGSRYELTLVNCVLTDEGQAEQPEAAYPAQDFEGRTDYVKVTVSAPEGAFPEGTTMTVADVEDEKTITDIEEKVSEGFVEVKRVHAVDITFWNGGVEIEPLAPVSVVISVAEIEEQQDTVVVHVEDGGATEVVESQNEAPAGETEVTMEMPASDNAPAGAEQSSGEGQADGTEESQAFSADSFSVYAVVVTETIETKYIDAEGETWNISVGFTKEANIPVGATLDVRALADEESAGYYDQTADALKGRETITMARFFDITIRNAEGAEVQPEAPVEVKVVLDETSGDAVKAVHFADEGMELIDADRDAKAVTFEAEGFSVYGIVYTVDFYYGVDGETYEYHINGGDVMSLRELLPILGVVAEDEAAGFVADTETVTFSDETLVKPVAVTEDTTAGAIVDALGVEIEYSGNLSEADVEAIRARAFTAPDWALVSLKPFNTEEALTITLKNGETLTLRVTDAQDPSTYLGKQIIIYDNGEKRAMTAENWGNDGHRTRFNSIPLSNADSDVKAHWTIESDNGGYYLKSHDGKYLKIDYYNVGLVDSKNDATLLGIQAGSNPDYRIYENSNYNNVLTYCDNKAYDGFFSAPNGANYYDSDNQRWLYIQVVSSTTNDNGYITVNDWSRGYLKNGANEFHNNVTDGQIGWNSENKNHQGIVAVAKPGYAFSHWTVTNTNGFTWNSGLYLKNTIEQGTFERAALTDRKERFTAVFKPVHQFTVKVAPGFESFGTYASKYLGTDASGNGIAAYEGQSYSNYGSANASTDDSAFKYGFGTTANEGYEFAFWMYHDQETGLFKGLRSINSGDVIPFNGVTYEAYFTEKGKKLIVYQSSDSAVGSVSKGYSYADEQGAMATVTNDAYVFTGWYDQDGNCVSTNPTFDPALASKSTVLTAEFAECRSGNVTFKVADGGQGTLRIADSETTSQKTVPMNENGDGKLEQKVVAVPNDGNSFIYWELNRNGNILRLSYDSATIDGNSWLTFQDGDTMTAYFSQGTERDFDASQTAQSDIEISDAKKRELRAWLDSLQKSHTASADKTAHVYDYDNRIYQIDITAESSLMDFEADIDLAFIIDVSNSMLFPSKFEKNGKEMILTQDNLNAAYPDGSTHYIISDPTGTSTAYRIFRKADGIWYYVDASLTDDVAHKIAWDCRYSETDWNAPYRYPIYDAVGSKRRVDYLNESMQSAIQSLHSILNNFKNAGGTTHDINLAYSTFAASVYSITPESPFVFNQFQSMKDNETLSISVRDTGGGTRQDLALRDARGFSWEGSHKKYAILITDGAPVVGSRGSIDGKSLDTIRNDIGTEAGNLKDQGVTLITVGLSTQNVLFGSNKLKEIASIGEDGKRLFFQAEHADDLENILLDILRMIMQQKTVSGEVTDVIDPAFYPVDQNGNPIAEGMYLNDGTPIGDSEHVGKPRYEWRKQDDRWVITYHNQIFGPDETWKQSVLVKSKEDFLGGNTIPTNVSASVQPTWYVEGGQWKPLNESAIDLPVPHVNVDELSLTQNSTAWTVYLGTEVNPLDELKRLYTQIDVNEVVSQTVEGRHVTMTSAGDMLYNMQKSPLDGRSPKDMAPETFKLSAVAPLTDDDWGTLIGGNAVEKAYSAYTHDNVGKIVYTLTKKVVSGEPGLEPSPHDTAVEGQNVEKYTLTATYVPMEQHTPEDGWHTTPGEARGKVTDDIQSVNGHVIHVFVKGLKIKKMDATLQNRLIGAKFRLYRPALSEETENTLEIEGGSYVPATEEFTVDGDGVADIGAIKALKSGNYYLVETKAPDGYIAAAPMKVALMLQDTFAEVPPNSVVEERPSVKPYHWEQKANLVLEGSARRSDENWNATDQTPAFNSETSTVYYRIPNNSGVSLPNTGGMGTTLYYVAGAALLVLALVLLLRKRSEN